MAASHTTMLLFITVYNGLNNPSCSCYSLVVSRGGIISNDEQSLPYVILSTSCCSQRAGQGLADPGSQVIRAFLRIRAPRTDFRESFAEPHANTQASTMWSDVRTDISETLDSMIRFPHESNHQKGNSFTDCRQSTGCTLDLRKTTFDVKAMTDVWPGSSCREMQSRHVP